MLDPETERKITDRLVVEPMRLEHLAEVYAIEVSIYPHPWSLKCFYDEVARNPAAWYVVATIDGGVVGYGGLWIMLDEAHVTNLATPLGYRRRGIAERMLVAMLDESLRRGVKTAFLEVRRHNTAAQALYAKYLFRTDTVRERYYTDNDEDALLMRVRDMDSEEFRARLEENRGRAARRTAETTKEIQPVRG